MQTYTILRIIFDGQMTFGFMPADSKKIFYPWGVEIESYIKKQASIVPIATLTTRNAEEAQATCWDYINAARRAQKYGE